MNIAEKILKLRKEKGLSQEAFAEKLGVSRQSVSKWEANGSLPDIDKIIAMSELFGVSTDYLLKDEADSQPQIDEAAEEPQETAEGEAADDSINENETNEEAYENGTTEYVRNEPEKKPKNKGKIIKTVIAAVLVVALTAAAVGIPTHFGGVKETWWAICGGKIEYDYVLVHGLGGWGESDGINNVAHYWGGGVFDLKSALEEEGYTVHTPSVGPVSSTWDRACELYAQLTGTRVDYGEAHSKAHNHERYGRTYTEPLVDDWGEKINGGQRVKINLIGHSFGGATVRLLTSLLENGNEAEINAGGDVSPLFTGGKGDYVHSVTTLCAPHNGSSLTEIINDVGSLTLGTGNALGIADTTDLLITLCFGLSGMQTDGGIFDLKLDHFGIDSTDPEASLEKLTKLGNDNAAYDLSPDGAAQLNDTVETVDGVYYLSYSYSTTEKGKVLGNQIPDIKTLPILSPFALTMGSYTGTTDGGISIDDTWKENDGLVNVVSAKYPFGEEYTGLPENADEIKSGIWNVAPTRRGDHGNVIGLNADKSNTLSFFTSLFDTLEELR